MNDLLAILERRVGNDLLSLYRCPARGEGYFTSSSAETLLLILIADRASIHRLREAFLAFDERASADKRDWKLLVTTRNGLRRHLSLNPLLAHHLAIRGECIRGQELFTAETDPPRPVERVAFLAKEAMEASAALAPGLLSLETGSTARNRLHQLANDLGQSPPSGEEPVAQLFALVQVHLCRLIDDLPPDQRIGDTAEQAKLGKTVLAAYQDHDRFLVVVSPPEDDSLQQIDWPDLAKRMPSRFSQLTVVTADQLDLIIRCERPYEYVLKSFQHLWGTDLLDGLQVSARHVFRQAARKPSHLSTSGVPAAYLAAADNQAVHGVIHDYQNKLLNIRLEHELLHRFYGVQAANPEDPLPRRDEPNAVRIEAILEYCDWWTAHYVLEMEACEPGQKMSPP